MLAKVFSCAILGLEAHIITVEVDFNPRAQIPSFTIVGLPDPAIKESRERVRSAIKNSNGAATRQMRDGNSQGMDTLTAAFGGQNPVGNHKQHFGLQFVNKTYVVNLSPADLPKHGPAYDLPIAVGVLAATDQIPLESLERALFMGELSLDGSVRHIKGIMPIVYSAYQEGFDRVYIPAEDAAEAGLVQGIEIIPVRTLGELVEHLYGLQPISPYVALPVSTNGEAATPDWLVDFADIKGQEHVKRALEIAAGGNHNVRLNGPPGVGKTLLARAMPGILPPLSMEEALEVTRIYSVADMLQGGQPLIHTRPFRAPHHTISLVWS